MTCKYCYSICIKKGKATNGKQRFQCKNCRKYQLGSYTYKSYSVSDFQITQLVKEGCGIRSISRLLAISTNTVLRRILRIAKAVSKPLVPFGQTYEMDELRTFVQQKSRLVWVAYAIRRDTPQLVDFKVGPRTLKTLKGVVDTLHLSKPVQIFTDKLRHYRYLVEKKLHSTKHRGTNAIERMNLNLRTHLKRLNRRSICFSKSLTMLVACLKIYFWG